LLFRGSKQSLFTQSVCSSIALTKVQFVRTPSDYYSWQLEERRAYIGAATTSHLCKSIVLENTDCVNNDCLDPLNSKYYCVIIQYTTRLSSHKVFKFVRGLKNNEIPQKNYHFTLAKDGDALTGFDHNAVCPVGMKTDMPIIVSKKLLELDPPYVWLGGGEVDLKMGINVNELLKQVPNTYVADVVSEEDEEDKEDEDDDIED